MLMVQLTELPPHINRLNHHPWNNTLVSLLPPAAATTPLQWPRWARPGLDPTRPQCVSIATTSRMYPHTNIKHRRCEQWEQPVIQGQKPDTERRPVGGKRLDLATKGRSGDIRCEGKEIGVEGNPILLPRRLQNRTIFLVAFR